MSKGLLRQFREAKDLYHSHPDQRRAGVRRALQAAITSLERAVPEVTAEGLHMPLLNLFAALEDLDRGVVGPILKPIPSSKAGAKPRSKSRAYIEAAIVAIADRLHDEGMDRGDADKKVALDAKRLGIEALRGRRRGVVSATTIVGWRKGIREDVKGRRTDRDTYEQLRKRFAEIPAEEAFKLLGQLAGVLHPEDERSPHAEK